MGVELIVRSSSQEVSDLHVSCPADWSVLQLKEQLANVYPGQPAPQHQRLVYLGRLLLDHARLEDLLPKGEENHVLHLVYTQPLGQTQSQGVASDTLAPGLPVDDLRQRAMSQDHSTPPQPVTTGNMTMQGDGAAPAFGSPYSMYSPSVAWLQHVYAQQQYYLRYQAMSAAALEHPSPLASQEVPEAAIQGRAVAVGEEERANGDVRVDGQARAAQEGHRDNDEAANHDWLDRVYSASHALLLFSILYFYSSLSRFVFVICAVLIVALHQRGWLGHRLRVRGEANPAVQIAAPQCFKRNRKLDREKTRMKKRRKKKRSK
uniref:homocysteine-responsive endoplasmic reticulum-resident ubiquitin-like domain member 2 protein isoform X2 n=1 Tax=Myxine glutinosa TaxID=7769 RepID=UPI00358EAC34